jgi:hypothetical protein
MMITPAYNNPWLPVVPLAGLPQHTPSRPKVESHATTEPEDVSADLSLPAILLSEEGLDFQTSSIEKSLERLDFHLEFNSGTVEHLSASGYYSEETKSLDITWSLSFQGEVEVDGRTELHTFEAKIQMHVDQVVQQSVSSYVQKEDILSLVRRLLQDLHEIAMDEDQALGGVVLEYADFQELFAVDNGRLAHDLMALIELTIMLARLRQMLDGNVEEVILSPEREETRGVLANEVNMVVESFQLEIRDVTAELSTTAAESQPAALSPEIPANVPQILPPSKYPAS